MFKTGVKIVYWPKSYAALKMPAWRWCKD